MGGFRTLFGCVLILVLASCLVVEGGRSGCKDGFGCWQFKTSASDGGVRMLSSTSDDVFEGWRPLDPRLSGGDLVDWDLRKAPSGPDPLHHNGSPRKPQTP